MKVAWPYPIHVTPLPKHQKTLSYNERPLFYSKNKKNLCGKQDLSRSSPQRVNKLYYTISHFCKPNALKKSAITSSSVTFFTSFSTGTSSGIVIVK